MTTDITELALITKIKNQLKNFDTVVLKEGEALALVEAMEKAQQYTKERDAENQDLMLTVGRLRVEREDLESRIVTVKLPVSLDFDCEMENGDYDIDEEPYLRGKVDGFNYALTKVRRLNGTAGIKWEAE